MNFVKTRSLKDYIISALLIAGGVTLIALPTSAAVNITGSLLALTGVILILVMKTGYRNSETKEMFNRKIYYFPASSKSQIINELENAPERIDVEQESTGNGLMLEFYYNAKCPKVFAKAYEYIPYKYEPCSEFIELERSKAEKFI